MATTTRTREAALTGESWGWMALRGVLAIVFGVLTLAWPGMTLVALVIVYGAYALADGVAALVFAARGGKTRTGKTWPLVVTGIAGIGAGIAAFAWPGLTSLVLLYIVAFWALMRGIFEVVAYFPLRKEVEHAWLIMLSGLVSLAFGGLLLSSPVAGILAMLWLVGIYAIVAGVVLLGLAFSMRRKLKKQRPVEPRGAPPAEATPA